MEMIETPQSSNIHSFGYDAERMALRVNFKNKTGQITGTWDYRPVPLSVFEDMQVAPSAGRFFQSHVKGVFTGERQ